MDYSMLLLACMGIPLVAALLMAVLPSKANSPAAFELVHSASLISVATVSALLIAAVLSGESEIFAIGLWFRLDALGCVFIGLIGAIGLLTGIYSIPYIRHDLKIQHMNMPKVKQYYIFFNLFVFTMMLAALSNNMIMMWVSIEATTLSTVFLVGSYKTKLALEAAWKYVIVCTAGVAFGLYSTVLVYANAADIMTDPTLAVFWTEVLPIAGNLDIVLVQIAFVFAVIGFGTKAGLFPMHTWLPDAHSEAPSPVSALLSGVLLKCAMLVIIRFYILAVEAIGPQFPQLIMLIIGIVSVAMAAFAVFSQDDLKRKLAYHSCENIGIIALCLGFGGPIGIFAALFHCVAHGLTKALLFTVSGNVMMKYGTRDLNKVSGIIKIAPVTGVVMAIGFFALAGFPPFAMFVSELLSIVAGVSAGAWPVVIVYVLALTVVVYACTHVVAKSVMGKPPEHVKKGDVSPLALIPQIVLVAALMVFGFAIPGPAIQAFEKATGVIVQDETLTIEDIFSFEDTIFDNNKDDNQPAVNSDAPPNDGSSAQPANQSNKNSDSTAKGNKNPDAAQKSGDIKGGSNEF